MQKKTLFSVFLPATGKSYEMWVPHDLSVYEAKELIGKLLEEQEGRFFANSDTTALYDKATGTELDVNARIGELGFVNGARFMFV